MICDQAKQQEREPPDAIGKRNSTPYASHFKASRFFHPAYRGVHLRQGFGLLYGEDSGVPRVLEAPYVAIVISGSTVFFIFRPRHQLVDRDRVAAPARLTAVSCAC